MISSNNWGQSKIKLKMVANSTLTPNENVQMCTNVCINGEQRAINANIHNYPIIAFATDPGKT